MSIRAHDEMERVNENKRLKKEKKRVDKLMSKEELKEIFFINKELGMWENELEKLQMQSLAINQQITGMPKGSGGKSDRVAELAITTCEIEELIQSKMLEIQREKKRIMEFIDQIQDSQVRQIVFLRNVSCKTWDEISIDIGGYNSADGVRKIYTRYLDAQNRI